MTASRPPRSRARSRQLARVPAITSVRCSTPHRQRALDELALAVARLRALDVAADALREASANSPSPRSATSSRCRPGSRSRRTAARAPRRRRAARRAGPARSRPARRAGRRRPAGAPPGGRRSARTAGRSAPRIVSAIVCSSSSSTRSTSNTRERSKVSVLLGGEETPSSSCEPRGEPAALLDDALDLAGEASRRSFRRGSAGSVMTAVLLVAKISASCADAAGAASARRAIAARSGSDHGPPDASARRIQQGESPVFPSRALLRCESHGRGSDVPAPGRPRAARAGRIRVGARGARDPHRVALVLEGGGMRGVVSAGMVAALEKLGMTRPSTSWSAPPPARSTAPRCSPAWPRAPPTPTAARWPRSRS